MEIHSRRIKERREVGEWSSLRKGRKFVVVVGGATTTAAAAAFVAVDVAAGTVNNAAATVR